MCLNVSTLYELNFQFKFLRCSHYNSFCKNRASGPIGTCMFGQNLTIEVLGNLFLQNDHDQNLDTYY